jgi:hypothetical protein
MNQYHCACCRWPCERFLPRPIAAPGVFCPCRFHTRTSPLGITGGLRNLIPPFLWRRLHYLASTAASHLQRAFKTRPHRIGGPYNVPVALLESTDRRCTGDLNLCLFVPLIGQVLGKRDIACPKSLWRLKCDSKLDNCTFCISPSR